MNKAYEDPVNRTLELYGSKISEALNQLKDENPNFGRCEPSEGKYVEAQYTEGEGVTGISFTDVKLLEVKVREITGDPEARLVRTIAERFEPRIATIDDSLNRVPAPTQALWLDKQFRAGK